MLRFPCISYQWNPTDETLLTPWYGGTNHADLSNYCTWDDQARGRSQTGDCPHIITPKMPGPCFHPAWAMLSKCNATQFMPRGMTTSRIKRVSMSHLLSIFSSYVRAVPQWYHNFNIKPWNTADLNRCDFYIGKQMLVSIIQHAALHIIGQRYM